MCVFSTYYKAITRQPRDAACSVLIIASYPLLQNPWAPFATPGQASGEQGIGEQGIIRHHR